MKANSLALSSNRWMRKSAVGITIRICGNYYQNGLGANRYLEEAYPGRKLLPQDPYKKAQDKLLLDSFAYVPVFKTIRSEADHMEGYEQFWRNAEIIDNELKKRKTKFLGGD